MSMQCRVTLDAKIPNKAVITPAKEFNAPAASAVLSA